MAGCCGDQHIQGHHRAMTRLTWSWNIQWSFTHRRYLNKDCKEGKYISSLSHTKLLLTCLWLIPLPSHGNNGRSEVSARRRARSSQQHKEHRQRRHTPETLSIPNWQLLAPKSEILIKLLSPVCWMAFLPLPQEILLPKFPHKLCTIEDYYC